MTESKGLSSATQCRGVFVNCPFDAEFYELMKAIIFTIMYCDCIPRCTREEDDSGYTRIEKIFNIIHECDLGIHDLSRTELDTNMLPRFNMPLELGIFLGFNRAIHTLSLGNNRRKKCLILEREQYSYQKYISDIAGHDTRAHNNEIEVLIKVVRNWLATHFCRPNIFNNKNEDLFIFDGWNRIHKNFVIFKSFWLPAICDEMGWSVDGIEFVEFCYAVNECLPKIPNRNSKKHRDILDPENGFA